MLGSRTEKPGAIEDAQVVLRLHIEVAEGNRVRFIEFCRRAFPVYESIGGARMALYEDTRRPGRFEEIGYYRTMADFERGEKAVREDVAHIALIDEWRSLLKGPPEVLVLFRRPI